VKLKKKGIALDIDNDPTALQTKKSILTVIYSHCAFKF